MSPIHPDVEDAIATIARLVGNVGRPSAQQVITPVGGKPKRLLCETCGTDLGPVPVAADGGHAPLAFCATCGSYSHHR